MINDLEICSLIDDSKMSIVLIITFVVSLVLFNFIFKEKPTLEKLELITKAEEYLKEYEMENEEFFFGKTEN